MKTGLVFPAAVIACSLWASGAALAQVGSGQSFAGAMPGGALEGGGMEGSSLAGDAPDSRLFADGTQAINQERWADAVAIFSRIAEKKGEHADGALFWKAYAENRLGQGNRALDVCGALRHDYPSSSWVDECGALEIEIRAKSGQPVQPKVEQDEDLKLLALNSLMHQNEAKALTEIDEILNGGNASEKMKAGALYLLGQYHADVTYPQIARVSYVEGDVRVARGLQIEKATGAAWEKAAANLPLETGFSLVTGAGRAEIEFENASTLYLGENSVLTFNDLSTTRGIPHTEVALLSGTASLHVKPFVAGEWFMLRTPTDTLVTKYPQTNTLRITSYMDGMAVTPQEGGVLHLPGASEQQLTTGHTLYYRDGRPIDPPSAADAQESSAWDKWVSDRLVKRSSAIAEVMEKAGLEMPIPGMEQLAGQGTFFDCAPYGTCWEPSAAGAQAMSNSAAPGHVFAQAQPGAANGAAAGTSADPRRLQELEWSFPCFPYAARTRILDPAGTNVGPEFETVPWEWAVCHTGTWIPRHNRYVWVAGHRRHHLGAGRWLRSGRTVAYVPLHPHDVKDHLPVNRTNPVFALGTKKTFEAVRLESGHPVELLKAPPREFRVANFPALVKAEEPRMEAHALKPAVGGKELAGMKEPGAVKVATAHPASIPIHFDPRAQTFNMARQEMQGGRPVTVSAPVTNRGGDLQAHSGGYSGSGSHIGGGGSAGGSSGGSHSGGGSSGSSGGSSHSGGGSSGPVSSGGGGSISVSSSSASSSSSSASSGGSHK